MRERPIARFRPGLERLEAKQLLSGTATTVPVVDPKAGALALTADPVLVPAVPQAAGNVSGNNNLQVPSDAHHVRRTP